MVPVVEPQIDDRNHHQQLDGSRLMRALRARRRRGDRGAAAVEFALVTVFALMPLLLGIIAFGFIFYGQLTITHAAREGVRKLSLCNSTLSSTCAIDAEDLTNQRGGGWLDLENQGTYDPPPTTCPDADPNNEAEITVKRTINMFFLHKTVTGRATMPCGG